MIFAKSIKDLIELMARAGLFFGHRRKNSRGEKLKEKTLKLKIKTQFSGILKEKINANFDNKCFFSSLFGRKEKKIQKSKKESKMAVQKLNRSQNLSKIFQKLKEKLKTQGKNSKIRHLIM